MNYTLSGMDGLVYGTVHRKKNRWRDFHDTICATNCVKEIYFKIREPLVSKWKLNSEVGSMEKDFYNSIM